MSEPADIGQVFSQLTIMSRTGSIYTCQCLCGNTTTVRKYNLTSGHTKSCGCYKLTAKITHGLSKHPLYFVWFAMITRCSPKCAAKLRPRYYGRGIRVCSAWKSSPVAFITWAKNAGWGPGLECDREDNDGNYSPDNCRFVDRITNASNVGVRQDSTSGYRGVSQIKSNLRWRSYITVNKKPTHLGYHGTSAEAASARNTFIRKNKLPHPIQEIFDESN